MTLAGSRPLPSALRTFRVGPGEAGALARILAGVARYEAAYRWASLPRLVGLFEKPEASRALTAQVPVDRLVRLTDAVLGRLYGRAFCLPRTLVLYRVLRAYGHDADVRLGVRRGLEGLDGHAWLEHEGHPLAEAADPRRTFRITFAHPPLHAHTG